MLVSDSDDNSGVVVGGRAAQGTANLRLGIAIIGRDDPKLTIQRSHATSQLRTLVHVRPSMLQAAAPIIHQFAQMGRSLPSPTRTEAQLPAART